MCRDGLFCVGIPIALAALVINFFMVGSERVTWELVSVDNGVYRLSISHSAGVIVEYFKSTAAALKRESELETLLTGKLATAQGLSR